MSQYLHIAARETLFREYPIGEVFDNGIAKMSRDALRALQQKRFLRVVARGWEIPFYRRRWSAVGLEPGDIRSLEDLTKIPAFSKTDLMDSVAAHPPFGDFHGLPDDRRLGGAVFHTTSGTTGTPQPLFYGPWDREVQNVLLARAYRLQGLTDQDIVHSVYGFGMVNGGHYVREAVVHFTNALFLPAGTGLETPSVQQVQLMKHFGATVLVGFADYLKRLAEVAADEGLVPGKDIPIRMISGHLGQDNREQLSAMWGGAELFDWYGVGDTGTIAAEGPTHEGLYIWEDAHLVESLHPDSGAPVADGTQGSLCVTVLFKHDIYPVIRFNTQDVTTLLAPSDGDITLRRMAGFEGRADSMVKLRGINVYPTAIGALLSERDEATGEYVCIVSRSGNRDEMTVQVEVREDDVANQD
ncbi:MAG: phenylacetate-CoA ligase, partial [Gammaproteobacteria bacterium]